MLAPMPVSTAAAHARDLEQLLATVKRLASASEPSPPHDRMVEMLTIAQREAGELARDLEALQSAQCAI